jgi:glycosyltransferase involved in cell wall biosynthesis
MQEHPDNPPPDTPGPCSVPGSPGSPDAPGHADPSVPPGKTLAIVPAYNEAASVGQVVNDLRQHLPQADVLVVDDGSTDDTHKAVPEGTPVLRLPFNLGIGATMQAGYRYALLHGYDTALQVDGDGQHPAREAPKLILALNESGADLVIGSRFLEAGPNHTPSAIRLMGIRVIRTVVRILTGLAVTDCTSGFRAANRRVIQAFARWYPDDYPEPQVIPLLHRAGYTVREIAVTMADRSAGRTSIPLHKGVFYILKVTLALLLDTTRRPWPKQNTPKARQP